MSQISHLSSNLWFEHGEKLKAVVDHFLLSQQSSQTRRSYARDIADFLEFCGSHGINLESVAHITERMLLLWQKSLEQKYSGPHQKTKHTVQTTVARKIAGVSSLLKFAFKRKLIASNPAELLARPRVKNESRTNALTATQVVEVLRCLEERKCSAEAAASTGELSAGAAEKAVRSAYLRFAVLHTLFTVGMRVDELCQLRICDFVNADGLPRLHMTAKGAEEHSPLIHPATAQVIEMYIHRCRRNALPHEYLFERAQKVKEVAPLSQPAVFQMMIEACAEAGVSQKVSPHSCRATVATLLHNSGVAIGHIQELLNHKQITTTALYVKKAGALEEAAARKMNWSGILDNE